MGSVAVDSGVIIALFDSSDVHHAWSTEQIQQIVTARHAVVISALTVAEVLVRPAQAGVADAVRADLMSLRPRVVDVDADLAASAARMRGSRSGLRLPDAIILATALWAQCDYLVTTDQRMAVAADGIPVRVSPPDLSSLRRRSARAPTLETSCGVSVSVRPPWDKGDVRAGARADGGSPWSSPHSSMSMSSPWRPRTR